MYAGRIVHSADADTLFEAPRHPYTLGLLRSMPSLDGERKRLTAIEGRPPDLREEFARCPFVDRCGHQVERCHSEKPTLAMVAEGHLSACWRSADL